MMGFASSPSGELFNRRRERVLTQKPFFVKFFSRFFELNINNQQSIDSADKEIVCK
jgi:hypothetical protein